MGADGFVELQSILMCLMDYGWGSVIEHGKITRIDIAVDLPNTRPAAFAVLPQQALVTKDWVVNGKLETSRWASPRVTRPWFTTRRSSGWLRVKRGTEHR